MFGWLLKLFKHECSFMAIENVHVRNKYGNSTGYMRLICEHPLCNNVSYIPYDNRKIHEEWIKKGDI